MKSGAEELRGCVRGCKAGASPSLSQQAWLGSPHDAALSLSQPEPSSFFSCVASDQGFSPFPTCGRAEDSPLEERLGGHCKLCP